MYALLITNIHHIVRSNHPTFDGINIFKMNIFDVTSTMEFIESYTYAKDLYVRAWNICICTSGVLYVPPHSPIYIYAALNRRGDNRAAVNGVPCGEDASTAPLVCC